MYRFVLVLALMTPIFWAPQVYAQTEASKPVEGGYVCPMKCDGLHFDKPGICPVCNMNLEPVAPPAELDGDFFGDELLEDAAEFDRPKTSLMPGLHISHTYVAAVLAMILALLLAFAFGPPTRNMERTSKRWEYPRFELTKGFFKRFVKWKGFQFALQVPVVAMFILVIAAGLFGNQEASENIAPVLTWNIWWMGLIFFAFFAGEIWCTVCPWMAMPDWVSRLGGWLRKGQPLGRKARWPKWARNLYPAIFMFIAVTWLELAYEAPYRPMLTALMGLGMVAMAFTSLFLFERKGFCRYVCPVGRVTGAYGTTGMLEIRRRDTDVCHSCDTKDCLNGNERGLPCPTNEFMGAMNENMYCTMCTECVRTCPHDNVALNVRAPFVDLMGPHRKRVDEAWLLLMITIVSVFHGLAMVPFWTQQTIAPLRRWGLDTFGSDPGYLTTFSVMMALAFALCIGVYALWSRVALWISGSMAHRVRDVFVAYSYALIPVALGYHLAHNALHFFYEGSKLIRLVSDPFGWGWDLFGTRDNPLSMLIPLEILWIAQVVLMLAGLMASVLIVRRTSYRMFGNRRQAKRMIFAACLLALGVTLICIWLLNQPMEMRTA